MGVQNISQLIRRRPCGAFRIHVWDGSVFGICRSELAVVERSKVVVGVPGPKGVEAPVERTVFCSLMHITRAEPVNGAPRT